MTSRSPGRRWVMLAVDGLAFTAVAEYAGRAGYAIAYGTAAVFPFMAVVIIPASLERHIQ